MNKLTVTKEQADELLRQVSEGASPDTIITTARRALATTSGRRQLDDAVSAMMEPLHLAFHGLRYGEGIPEPMQRQVRTQLQRLLEPIIEENEENQPLAEDAAPEQLPLIRPANEQGMLEEIGDHPDDEELPAMYADQLEERLGKEDPQVLFMHHELQREKNRDVQPNFHLQQQVEANLKTMLEEYGVQASIIEFRHGLPSLAVMDAEAFIAQAPTLFRLLPSLRGMYIKNAGTCWERLLACPHLSRLSTLELDDMGDVLHHLVPALNHCPHLEHLQNFALPNVTQSYEAERLGWAVGQWYFRPDQDSPNLLESFLSSPLIGHLHTLHLNNHGLRNEDIPLLTNSTQIPRLQMLNLQRNRFDAVGIRALLAAPSLQHLRLDLRENYYVNEDTAITEGPLTAAEYRRLLGIE